jgi:argininosuccinate lyase
VGHHFASEVVKFARQRQLLPRQFPYAEAQRLYAEAMKQDGQIDTRLPLDEAAFRRTLSPADMVRTRVGVGGPQPAETRRMLDVSRRALSADRDWVNERRNRLAAAEARLNESFTAVLAR